MGDWLYLPQGQSSFRAAVLLKGNYKSLLAFNSNYTVGECDAKFASAWRSTGLESKPCHLKFRNKRRWSWTSSEIQCVLFSNKQALKCPVSKCNTSNIGFYSLHCLNIYIYTVFFPNNKITSLPSLFVTHFFWRALIRCHCILMHQT